MWLTRMLTRAGPAVPIQVKTLSGAAPRRRVPAAPHRPSTLPAPTTLLPPLTSRRDPRRQHRHDQGVRRPDGRSACSGAGRGEHRAGPRRGVGGVRRAAAAPRRRNAGGRTSSTMTPAGMHRVPGSRSSARSPIRSGNGCRKTNRTVSAPSGRTRAPTAAAPTCNTISVAKSSDMETYRGKVRPVCPDMSPCRCTVARRTSMVRVASQVFGVSRAAPRCTASRGTPRRLTATRATAGTDSTGSPKDCSPRTVTVRPGGTSSSSSPTRSVPPASVPVTTVPAPRMVNARSTHRRTSASTSGAGSLVTNWLNAARSSSSPAPVEPETQTAGIRPKVEPARCSSASSRANSGSIRSLRVTTSRPCRTFSACSASRCSADCGIQPSSAATTNSTAGTGPTPASMFGTNRSCPGTSTNATVAPVGRVVQANPRSMVMPRRSSSAHRSGSIPVNARTRVDFPWST